MSVVTLAMHHRLVGLSTYRLNGHGQGDEHPTFAQYWGMVNFAFMLLIDGYIP